MFPSTSELAFQYKQSTWYQAVTKDLGTERAAGRKKYYVPTYYWLARTFSFTTRARSLIIVSPSMAPRRRRKTLSSQTALESRSSRRCGF
jgi:hypothetical protein